MAFAGVFGTGLIYFMIPWILDGLINALCCESPVCSSNDCVASVHYQSYIYIYLFMDNSLYFSTFFMQHTTGCDNSTFLIISDHLKRFFRCLMLMVSIIGASLIAVKKNYFVFFVHEEMCTQYNVYISVLLTKTISLSVFFVFFGYFSIVVFFQILLFSLL